MCNNKFLKIVMILLMSFASTVYIPDVAASRTRKYSTRTTQKAGKKRYRKKKRYQKKKQYVSSSKKAGTMLKKLEFLHPDITLSPRAPKNKVVTRQPSITETSAMTPDLSQTPYMEKDESSSQAGTDECEKSTGSENSPIKLLDDYDSEEYWGEGENMEGQEGVEEEEEGEEEAEEEEVEKSEKVEEEESTTPELHKINAVNITYIQSTPCSTMLVSVNPKFSNPDSDKFADQMFQEIQEWRAKLDASKTNLHLICIPKKIHDKFVEKSVNAAGGHMEWYTLDPEFLIDKLPDPQKNLLKVGYNTDGYLLMFHERFFSPYSSVASTIMRSSSCFIEYISNKISSYFDVYDDYGIADALCELKPILTDDNIIEGINQITQSLFVGINGPWKENFFQDNRCQQTVSRLATTPLDENCRKLLDEICKNINHALRENNFYLMFTTVNRLNSLRLILAFTSF